jgi:hypothetical protein
MSNLRRRQYLKKRFEDGDRPDGDDFKDLIYSSLNQKSDQIFAVDQKLGIGTRQPRAPLEIQGSTEMQKQSFIATDGCNSTVRIAHPQNTVSAMGSNTGESLQFGNFDSQSGVFTPNTYISESGVGIGAMAEHASLDVKTTLWVGESLGIAGGVLYYKNNVLYLKTSQGSYAILTKKTGNKPSGWKIFFMVLGGIILILIIVALILYLTHNY